MVCRYDIWVWLFGHGIYFANGAIIKICPGSTPAWAFERSIYVPMETNFRDCDVDNLLVL